MVDPVREFKNFVLSLNVITLILLNGELVEKYLPISKLPVPEREHHHRREPHDS